MTLLGLAAGLLTILAAGFGITTLVTGRTTMNLLETAALSWLTGTGLVSLLLWCGGALFSGGALRLSVTFGCLALAAFGLFVQRDSRVRGRFPRPRNLFEWLLSAAIGLEFATMFYVSSTNGLGWDGLLNWEVKARYAFLNHGVLPTSYYSDVGRAFMHPGYPLLIPFSELWLYLWMGEAHQFWIKAIFPLYYIAGAVLLATIATRLTARRWLGLVCAALLFFVPCLTNTPGGVQVGYADVPLGVLYLAAIGYLVLYANDGAPSDLNLFALMLTLLPWAKREGAILWLIAAACGAVVIVRRTRSIRAFLLLAPGALIICAWKVFLRIMHEAPTNEFLPLNASTLVHNASRITPLCRAVLAEMVEPSRWSFFWPIVAIAFASLAWRNRSQLLFLFVAVVGPMSAYAATYLFSAWPDWTSHIETSFSRLLLHVMPVAWIAIARALEPPALPDFTAASARTDLG